jgi:hypothetical protein
LNAWRKTTRGCRRSATARSGARPGRQTTFLLNRHARA